MSALIQEIKQIQVGTFVPKHDNPDETRKEVHLIVEFESEILAAAVMRFKSPRGLTQLIHALIEHRDDVFGVNEIMSETNYLVVFYQRNKPPKSQLSVFGNLTTIKMQTDGLREMMNLGLIREQWYGADISDVSGKVVAKISHDGQYILNDGTDAGRTVRYGVWFNEAVFNDSAEKN